MFAKVVLVCASAFFVQSISGQCIGGPYNPGYIGNGLAAPGLVAEAALANGLGYGAPFAPGVGCGPFPAIPAASGGGFHVTSSSPIAPSGVSVQTDSMAIEGPLAVSGQLPFLGVVALEGPLPIAGQGVVSYGCGNGNIGIVNEVGPAPGPVGYPNPEFGYGYGYNGYPNALGCGCGPYY
ncbi:chorion class CB protein M5H4-like [Epargyreus clarus]|uniref:chorion class CB protein M5H4-like n=1 Tax=Epargyreus clarus TaxID=520877 RepID=UPI003C2D7642